MADAHKNFAYSTVATAPTTPTAGTTLVIAAGDGAKFPAVPFNATIWPANSQPLTTNAEIVRVTAIATDTLTITRTQESSTNRSVVVGDQIAATITSKTLTDIETGMGGQASRTADSAAINTTETVLATITIPTPVAGTTYRAILHGTCTSSASNLSTFAFRAGTAGTVADALIAQVALSAATTGTNNIFRLVFEYTLRTTGTTGNGQGMMHYNNFGTTGISASGSGINTITTSAVFNTTTATKLSVTYKSAATTTTSTFQNAIIEIVKP